MFPITAIAATTAMPTTIVTLLLDTAHYFLPHLVILDLLQCDHCSGWVRAALAVAQQHAFIQAWGQ